VRSDRSFAGAALLLVVIAVGLVAGQDVPKADTGRLPKYFDRLELTDAQKAEVANLAADHRQKREKLLEELRKLDDEAGRKKVAVLTDAQMRKLVELMAEPVVKKREGEASRAVPFEIKKEVILLDVTVNGKGPYKFLLDTGAGSTVLSPALAKKLDLKTDKKGDAVGAGGGKADVKVARVQALAVGATSQDNVDVVVMDIADVGSAIGVALDGIIGYTLLKNYRVVIDYPGKTVRFDVPAAK
jgi:predicted aspartyl protease